jgi:hypothetical protein
MRRSISKVTAAPNSTRRTNDKIIEAVIIDVASGTDRPAEIAENIAPNYNKAKFGITAVIPQLIDIKYSRKRFLELRPSTRACREEGCLRQEDPNSIRIMHV